MDDKRKTDGCCFAEELFNPEKGIEKRKCIFLDRDGTVNKHVGYLRSADQVELEQNAAEAIRWINQSEYLAIVITNQAILARGECSFEEMGRIHERVCGLLDKEGAYLDGLYFCPHHPDKGCDGEVPELKIRCNCRKPKTGMILQAMNDYNLDLSGSWLIGDTSTDILTGANAGLRTILLRCGDPDKKRYGVRADYVADDLLDAIKIISIASKVE